MQIKCIVAAYNSNGEPELVPVIVDGTPSEIASGEHYDKARAIVEDLDYDHPEWVAGPGDTPMSQLNLPDSFWD
jgi:hypothetical protein